MAPATVPYPVRRPRVSGKRRAGQGGLAGRRLTVLWLSARVPRGGGGESVDAARHPRLAPRDSPARATPPDLRTRDADSTERRLVHRQPRPTHAGPTGAPSPARRSGKEGKKGLSANGEEGEPAGSRTAPGIPNTSLHLGGRRQDRGRLRQPQPRKSERFRLMTKRPSDRRSPGRNPGPQGAFEVSMINVSCNSH